MKAQIAELLRQGKAVAAEIPAHRSGCRAFVRAIKLPQGDYVAVRFEMSEHVIDELEDRWDTNDDYLDKQSETVDEPNQIDGVLERWGLEPNVLMPAWQVDVP